MGAVTIQQMADRVGALLKLRLGVRGGDLTERMRRARRRLPRKVRIAGDRLAAAAARAQNPKLLLQIDDAEVASDYDTCLRHLNARGRGDRVRGRLVGSALGVVFSLAGVAFLLALVLKWRGYW